MNCPTPLGPARRTRAPERSAVTERALQQALLVALAVVIALCGARALADRLCGLPSGEGTAALVLVVLLTAWFAAEAVDVPSIDETPRRPAKRRTASSRR